MKINIFKYLFLAVLFVGIANVADAQKKKKASSKRTTPKKTNAKIQGTTPTEDPEPVVAEAPKAALAEEKVSDSLPVKLPKKSLRPDEAVETSVLRERAPLAYEHLRADDAVYRHRVWREIDTREKMNQTFTYSADADNGNQRFISILFQALQDSTKQITAFNNVDDRFTTPMTKAELVKAIVGDPVDVPDFDSVGNLIGTKKKNNDINLDSFYRFQIKEEVRFAFVHLYDP